MSVNQNDQVCKMIHNWRQQELAMQPDGARQHGNTLPLREFVALAEMGVQVWTAAIQQDNTEFLTAIIDFFRYEIGTLFKYAVSKTQFLDASLLR